MTDRTPGNVGALILGGAHGALAMARSLGRHGISVGFVTENQLITQHSRYVRFSTTWAGANGDSAAAKLLEIGRRYGLAGWVLLPGGDTETLMIARHRDELASFFRVTTPDWNTAQWALDKHLTYQRADALGIAHPQTYHPADRQEVADLDCRFPLVLKPATRLEDNAFTLGKAWRVDNKAALLSRYDQAVAVTGGATNIVLQELIPGGGASQFSYAALWDRGQPVVSLVARRLRQYPIEFGYTSTFVETIENAEVEAPAVRFLQSLDYSGLVEIEFKYDNRTQQYMMLDANIRCWTWIALGHRAGLDFPYLLWQLATGQPVIPGKARAGVAWMHFSRDLVAALQEMKAGRMLPIDYLRTLRASTEFAALAFDDPLPGILDLPLLVARVLTRRVPLLMRGLKQRIARRRGSSLSDAATRLHP
ncbi:MAG: ATP-grasp domain-containing protein [Pseudolabrys sp.]